MVDFSPVEAFENVDDYVECRYFIIFELYYILIRSLTFLKLSYLSVFHNPICDEIQTLSVSSLLIAISISIADIVKCWVLLGLLIVKSFIDRFRPVQILDYLFLNTFNLTCFIIFIKFYWIFNLRQISSHLFSYDLSYCLFFETELLIEIVKNVLTSLDFLCFIWSRLFKILLDLIE